MEALSAGFMRGFGIREGDYDEEAAFLVKA